MDNAVIGINFKDGDISSYKGVHVFSNTVDKIFNTGDITIDWINMYKFISDKSFDHIACSSSVDHFVRDSNGKFKRLYIDHDDNNKIVIDENCLMYIVKASIKSFEQHLKYYKNRKNDTSNITIQ